MVLLLGVVVEHVEQLLAHGFRGPVDFPEAGGLASKYAGDLVCLGEERARLAAYMFSIGGDARKSVVATHMPFHSSTRRLCFGRSSNPTRSRSAVVTGSRRPIWLEQARGTSVRSSDMEV